MKSLAQEVKLDNKIEAISISDLRARPGDVFTQVELGKVFIITRQGVEVAVISKVPGTELAAVVHPDGHITYKLAT